MPDASSAAAAVAAAVAALDLTPPSARVSGAWHPDAALASSVEPWPTGAVAPSPADGAWVLRVDGVPAGRRLCVKDLIDVAGLPTRAGTADWSRLPMCDAPAVAALAAAGWEVAGKGHTNELAYGCDGRNPHFPACPNPWDPERLAGGSSSGPAAAVAAGEADLGLGSDTSGSIRIPAALCGVAGLRPTLGLVSTAGVVPLSPSFDAVGPLARDVATLARATAALAGWPVPPAPLADLRRVRVGVLISGPPWAVDAAPGHAAVARAGLALGGLGAELLAVDLPSWSAGAAAQRAVQFGESAEVHARRFGDRPPAYSPPVRDRLLAGRAMALADVARARRAVKAFRVDVLTLFEEHRLDALLLPAALDIAPRTDANDSAVRDALLAPVAALSATGLPALALPVARLHGLPLAVQLVAAPQGDALLLALAGALERAGSVPSTS